MKEIEKLDTESFLQFPSNRIDENKIFAEKMNEVIDRVNRLSNPPAVPDGNRAY